jgi:polysaccharide deacetylase 2 family uncharacterized protein YibQ
VAGRTNKQNRRKHSGVKTWISVLVVALIIGAALAGLEWIKSRNERVPTVAAPPAETVLLPKPMLAQLSTAVKPVQRPVSTPAAPVAPVPQVPRGKPGRVAIIIDDMGTSLQEVKTLMGMGIPLSFSVIPGLAKAAEVANFAHQQGYQVMIHLPMEPEGYPQRRLEKNGLLLSHSSDELRQRVMDYLKAVPNAQGANNHMGSRFTTDREKMRIVLGVLQENSLFFVDSVTSPKSIGLSEARQMGMKTAARQVFLDNVQDVQAIRKQLLQLAAVAKKRGGAIGICHPHPTTIKALQLTLPELAKSGITFVSAGELAS